MPDLVVRRAEERELPQVAALAAELVRMHHRVDPVRFLLVENVEQGYARWFRHELGRKEAVILVALLDGKLAGYTYAAFEGRDWNLLLDEHGAIHDVFVVPEVRRAGVGRALMEATVRELEAMGAKRIVLSTMVQNESAQALFRACGFRPTMVEMTRG